MSSGPSRDLTEINQLIILLSLEIELEKFMVVAGKRKQTASFMVIFASKMEACSRISCPDYPWQATIPKIIAEMKYVVKALANSSDLFYHQVPKKFTSESIFMISILVTFMLIAAIGTAITIFENFCKLRTEGNHSRDVCKKRVISKNNIIARTYKDKESKEISSHE
ncbi:hypothetical protein NPIL_685271, partial [Nephila pilipes]